MKVVELYRDGDRRWVYFGRDPERGESLIDTNEYLITHAGRGLLPDPGGIEVFPAVAAAVSGEIDHGEIDAIFASHQDPDVISSLFLWHQSCPQAKVYCPRTWSLFLPHFAGGAGMTGLPDEGAAIPLGGSDDLSAIPAHYVHSSGCFTLYDPRARILFSADIGAALLPEKEPSVFVENFTGHVKFMEGFHKRWMPSNEAKNRWIRIVRQLDVNMLCPQHGAIFRGDDVKRFLDWFEALDVGCANQVEPRMPPSAKLRSPAASLATGKPAGGTCRNAERVPADSVR